MYDNQHLHFLLPAFDAGAEQRLARSPAFAQVSGEPDSRGRLRASYRGLRLDYVPATRWGRVRGSLHTFAHGHNAGRFTASEIEAACAELSEVLAMPAEWLTVRRLEVGLNLSVPTPPRPFLESLISHKKSLFTALNPPAGAARPLEYCAFHSAYRLKFYDKGAYARLKGEPHPPGHLLRYELVYTQARPLLTATGLATLTLADLPRPPVRAAFLAQLRLQWNLTHRRTPMDYTGLPLSDSALLHAANDVAFWEAMRKTQPRATYKRNRARAMQLLQQGQQRTEAHPYEVVFTRELENREKGDDQPLSP
ncbi:hypothetical protein [Hymenobacter sp. DG25A]|uniref:hypothetical protein n=1 Tax=Hymenobacter sp. DG25A TaxID=1385663 RepID=UPI0006BD4D68|nr:hypothetical protein [Hymenobacter sp. DG25A]ALD21322.1 hypothetical protein AM218_08955 [Hymenobacter sp. DG25A]